ncbi:MAG: amino acid adenylation domain-containing protein, partial [bacterium]|nr:amino acid adenylation domain-containing protein [bacterium]
NGLAQLLRQRGVAADTIVGIMAGRLIETIIGILGILKAGGGYLPIDPGYPRERIAFMMEDSGAKTLLTRNELLARPDVYGGAIQELPLQKIESQNASSLQIAYVIYTSGTTGKPKGVLIDHRNVARLLFNDQFQFDFSETDSWTLFHSFCFDFSAWEMYGALLYGGKLVIIPKMTSRDSETFLKRLKQNQITILNQTPSAFYNLVNLELRNSRRELNLRYIIFGGEALAPARLREWQAIYPGTKLINMYGITETTVHVTFKEITAREIESNTGNIGQPIPTLTTYLMDKYLRLVPIGVAGELYVGGEGVGRGYLNRPELTREKFVFTHRFWHLIDSNRRNIGKVKPGSDSRKSPVSYLYRTGDQARWLADGELDYLGRIDQQVKIRGFRIEPGEIENRLLNHPGIKEAVMLAREEKNGDKYLCAYIVPVSAREDVIPGLREYLALVLPGYMIPAYFVPLEKIPLTPNGKIDRKALPKPELRIGTGYAGPRNEIETKLVELWSNVLNIERDVIGIDSSFFHLGGHSLKATSLVSKIHKEFDVRVPLLEVFKTPRIRELAEYINGKSKETYISIDPAEK